MADYKLISGFHRHRGTNYEKGDTIRNLSDESAARIGLDRLQRVASKGKSTSADLDEPETDTQEESNAWSAYLAENRAPEILEKLSSDDLELSDLESILAAEQSGQNRVTIIRRVKDRIAQEKASGEEKDD